MRDTTTKAPLKIALTYAIVAGVYILVSDRLVGALSPTREAIITISQIKGWGFVLLTGFLLYIGLRKHLSTQQKIQDALRESNERLALITATTPVFLFEIDRTGAILHATKPFHGMQSGAIVGTNFFSVLPDERRAAIAAIVEKTLQTSTPMSLEYTARADGQQPRTFSLTIAPLHLSNGSQHLLVTAYDITQLRAVEERVRLQARLLDAVGQAVIATDLNGIITYWNNAAETMYGWTSAEVLGRKILDVMPADAAHAEASSSMERLRCDERSAGQFSVKRKDGSSFLAFVTKSPIMNDEGKVTGIISIAMDISAQKKTEEELRRSYERFELVSRVSSDTIWDWDITSGSLWISDAFFQKYGYPRSGALTLKDWDAHIHPEDRERVLNSLLTVVEQKAASWEEEFRYVHANGSTSYVVGRGFLVCNEQGIPVRMLCSMVDVTTLKLAELDQRYLAEEREKLLRQLRLQFERMPVGYVLFDRNFHILEWNPSCERIFGFTRDEVLGRSPFGLVIAPSLEPFILELLERLKMGKETLTRINENLTKDRRTILCEWFDTPLFDEHGTYAGMMAMVQDITLRRQAEEELKKSNIQLRHLSAYLQSVREQERKHIAREIHDELGQELTALKMQAAILQKAIVKLEGAVPKTELLEITGSLTAMADTSIRTVRRIATELRPDVLDKVGLIDALKWQAQEFEKRTGVVCSFLSRIDEWDFPDDVATALFRIFQEALTNVSRHAAATRVAAELSLREGWVDFRVEDNGRGITKEQVENTSSLGLLGLVERARLLGGTATIVGVPGAGTTIRVQLPLPSQNASKNET